VLYERCVLKEPSISHDGPFMVPSERHPAASYSTFWLERAIHPSKCTQFAILARASSQIETKHKMAIHGQEWIKATSAEPRMRTKVVLAAFALLYRISWPFIDIYSTSRRQSTVYLLLTKFLFVFIGLSCFVSLFPALKSKSPELCRPANKFVYYTALVICLLVTTINYVAVWRWALIAIDQYFTRGYLFNDPSPFDQTAVVVCSCILSSTLLALVAAQWMRVGSHWWEARKALWTRDVQEKDGWLRRTSSPVGMGKTGL